MHTTASVENFIDSVGALALCCAIAAKLLPRAGPTGRFLSRHCRTPKPARAPETVAHATAPGRVSQRPIAGAQPLPFLTLPDPALQLQEAEPRTRWSDFFATIYFSSTKNQVDSNLKKGK